MRVEEHYKRKRAKKSWRVCTQEEGSKTDPKKQAKNWERGKKKNGRSTAEVASVLCPPGSPRSGIRRNGSSSDIAERLEHPAPG